MYTFDDFRRDSQDAHDRAERICAAMRDRMSKLAIPAGLDPRYPAHHAHNAMVGLEYGRPWRGVDYSLVRQILRLSRRMSEVRQLADKRSRKLWNRMAEPQGWALSEVV